MVVKTYRGLLADGGQDRIRLQTLRGKVGYRIIKFELLPNNPSTETPESVVKIYKAEQTTVTSVIDFSDNTMLAAGYYSGNWTPNYPQDLSVIFDNEIFNQDIYITHKNDSEAKSVNYYIELEVIPLTDHGAEFTTLKDMRQS